MADTAAHLVDRVLPAVPIRQWVLSLPYPLRYRFAYDASLTSGVLRAFLRALFAELRRRVRRHWGVRAEQCGAVTFLQRFGSALNLNLHFHTLVLDGVYPYADGHGETPRFLALPPPTRDEVARVLAGTARRLAAALGSRADEDDDPLARDEPLLAALSAASLARRIADGPQSGPAVAARRRPHRPGEIRATPRTPRRVCPSAGGISLHADRGRARARSPPPRAAVPLRRPAAARQRAPRGAPGWPAPLPPEDPLARRHHAHRDEAKRTIYGRSADPQRQRRSRRVQVRQPVYSINRQRPQRSKGGTVDLSESAFAFWDLGERGSDKRSRSASFCREDWRSGGWKVAWIGAVEQKWAIGAQFIQLDNATKSALAIWCANQADE